ncbi:hypothetical protein D3C81_740670 [compost metagenome]
MRKQRFYYGKCRLKHRNGWSNGRWVVPTMLRDYFALRICLLQMNFSMKLSMNSVVGSGINATAGMMGDKARKILTPAEAEVIPDESKDHYTKCMQHRRKIAKALDNRVSYSIQKMQVIHDEAEAFFNPPKAEAA